jgi:hypothetical protein
MALKSLLRKTYNHSFKSNFPRRTFAANYEVDESRAKALIETDELESILGNDNVKVINATW